MFKVLKKEDERDNVLRTRVNLLEKKNAEALAENVRLWHKIEALQTELEQANGALIVMHDRQDRILKNEDGLAIRSRCFNNGQ